MATKAILKILSNEVGGKKVKQVKWSTRDEETVEVYTQIDGEMKQLLGKVTYKPDGTPDPTEDKFPTVDAGENQTVKEGVTVTLDGSAQDDGTITSSQWILPDGIVPTEENEKELIVKFKAPTIPIGQDYLLLSCTLAVEDDKGQPASKQCLITVVKDITQPPVPPIPPAGNSLYNSNTIGRWGENRIVTDFDPLFPQPFVNGKGFSLNASGTNAKAVIENGVLTLSANKGHKRIYIDSSNYNTFTTGEIRFNDLIVRNSTIQKQSRHNHGGELENKFGGFNHLIDLEGQKCGLKIELWHTGPTPNHIDGGNEVDLPFKIEVGQWVFFKVTDKINGRDVLSRTELSQDGQNWKLGKEFTYDLKDSKYDFIFNKPLYLQSSATWYRINPNQDGTKGISLRNIEDFQL